MGRFKWSKCLNLKISKVIFGINLKIYNYGRMCRKIYCHDRCDNDNALAAAIMANCNNRRDDCRHRLP